MATAAPDRPGTVGGGKARRGTVRKPPGSRVRPGRFEPAHVSPIEGRQPTGAGVLLDLRNRLVAWESRAFGDPLDAYRDGVMARYLDGLRRLLQGEASRERAVLMAVLALGPRHRGLPGAGDLGPLVGLAVETPVDVLDVAIAWGAGWGRSVWPEHEWHARWTAAVLALASLVGSSINRTVAWLADNVTDLREVLYLGGERELRERLDGFSDAIALELATGRCRCGHGDSASRSAPGTCARPQHRLESWGPERCRLHAFVATAVRGSAQVPVRAGRFAVSMLAGLMEAEHLLRVGVAEFSVCHACNGDMIGLAANDRARIRLSSVERGLYDIPRCPSCERAAHPDLTYRAARKNWMLVPADWGGQYHAVERHRCAACGNLFTYGRVCCPICDWRARRGGRLTTVWVRLAGLRPLVA
jgi:hypothetical protein